MSNPTVLTTFANPDPLATIQSTQELIDLLNTLVATSIQGTYVPYVIGSVTPAVADQDKAWVRIDGSGRPMGTYVFYGGEWRKQPTGLLGEIRVFAANPSIYFDTNGLGKQAPDDWDGWGICNGNTYNGVLTPDLSNLFIVGGDMKTADVPSLVGGYGTGWTTKVTGSSVSSGGAHEYMLTNDNLPYTPLSLGGYNYNNGGATHDPQPLVDADRGSSKHTVPIGSFGPDPSTTPPGVQLTVPTIPPFYVAGYAMFVGYA